MPNRKTVRKAVSPSEVDVKGFFESRFRRYGHSPKTLDWSAESQQLRFRVLSEIGDLKGERVADLGCGLGDLWRYLSVRFADVSYTGYDFSELFVREASRTVPNARFEVLDILKGDIPRRFDFVLSSGMHNLETGTNDQDMDILIQRAWKAAEKGVAINMLSASATRRTAGRHYYDPKTMLMTAMQFADYVVLRHDYLPHDFTLYLYRRAPRPAQSERNRPDS